MFETVRNAFKLKEIRSRIIYTLLMLVVVRIGTQLPIPGVNGSYFRNGFQAIQAALSDFLMQLPAVLSRRCRYLH